MGELYSVLSTDSTPNEASVYFETRYCLIAPKSNPGKRPTYSELAGVLDSLKKYQVEPPDIASSSQTDIVSASNPDEWTTLVITSDRPKSNETLVAFYFEKGSISVIITALNALSQTVGTLLLRPHSGNSVMICTPGSKPATFGAF